MNAADRLAALEALQHGVAAAIVEAKAEVQRVRELTGAKSFTTEFGTVSIASRKPTVVLDDRFTAWVAANHPDEIVQTVSEAFEKKFKTSLIITGDQVCTRDGEVLEFAHVRQGGEYVSSRLSDQVKADVVAQITANWADLARIPQVTA